ncbi:hypothetical protein O3M35_000789 [Rhynocoris fuscipes]|uniref:4-coumarate--CoA ligase n=1 Tax=Rhynocoris fuscipes TaxID=488301 RepID=A0AAW1DQ22_9HEMI
MRSNRLIRKLLAKVGIYSKYPGCELIGSSLSIRCINTNAISLQRLLSVNNVYNSNTKSRNCSKWTPNIRKSEHMNYPIPEGTLVEHIWSRADQWSDKVALVCGVTGREIRYHELKNLSKRVATSLLTDLGLSHGDVIGTILPNLPEYAPIIFGAFEAGIVVTPINPMYTADELVNQLKDSGAVAAVSFPDKLPTILEVVSKLNKPDFKIILTPNPDGNTIQSAPDNVIHYSHLVSDNVDIKQLNYLKPKTVKPDDTVLIPYSSGTTGKPKGVCLTNRNLLANNVNMRYVRDVWDTTSTHQDVVPMVLPTFHVYGLAVVLANSLYSGAKVITLPKFEESTFLRSLKDYKATVLFIAPPLVLYLANSPSVTKEHLSSVRTIVSGAAPLSQTDIMKCFNKMPANINFKQGYGLTETSPAVCYFPESVKPNNLNTVGFPLPNTQVKVIDLQTHQALGANDEGEIVVKGPQVMKGYLNNPKATEECIDKDGWFHTGDVGYYDEQGFFYITDRVKELIKVKGFQVAPSELEAVLRAHPDVQDCGVIGVPDPDDGEVPIAFVQSKIKEAKLLEDSLRKHLSDKLARYKHVSKYIFVDGIPKSAAGKILRKDLQSLYLSMTVK